MNQYGEWPRRGKAGARPQATAAGATGAPEPKSVRQGGLRRMPPLASEASRRTSCPLSTGHGRRTWFAVRRLATALPGVAPGLTHVHLRRLFGGHFQPSHKSRSPRAMSLAHIDRCRPALGDSASRPRGADQWPAAVTTPDKHAGRALACDAKRSRLGQHANVARARR